jgi:DNA-directed RNA polymerase specialized sigma24 family protein
MSSAPPALAPAFALLRSAITPSARSAASGEVYSLAHQPLTRRCTAMIRRLAPAHWLTGEDLASSTLIRVVIEPALAHACSSSTSEEILRFLHRVAFHQLRSHHEVRVAHARWKAGLPTVWVGLEAAAHEPHAIPDDPSDADAAFWSAYREVVRHLPLQQQRAWALCVEHELPMMEVAHHLGIDRTTVWRHTRAAAASLQAALSPLLASRRWRSPSPSPAQLPVARRGSRAR